MNENDVIRYVASHGPAMEPYIGSTIGPDTNVPRELFSVGPSGVPQMEDMAPIGTTTPTSRNWPVSPAPKLRRGETDARRGTCRQSAHVPPRGRGLSTMPS